MAVISSAAADAIAPLTHCVLGDFNEILDEYFSSQFFLQWLMAEILAVKFPLAECH